MNIRFNAKSFFFAVGTKVQISSCLIPNYTLEVSVNLYTERAFLRWWACYWDRVSYMYSYKFDSTLNLNHLLISFFVKYHPLAFIILSLWFVFGLCLSSYIREWIFILIKKFQMKFSRLKLTFDLVGLILFRVFGTNSQYLSLRSKRFRLVSEQNKTEERDFRF